MAAISPTTPPTSPTPSGTPTSLPTTIDVPPVAKVIFWKPVMALAPSVSAVSYTHLTLPTILRV